MILSKPTLDNKDHYIIIRVRGWPPSGLCFPCARWLGPGKVFWFLLLVVVLLVVVLPGGFGLFP